LDQQQQSWGAGKKIQGTPQTYWHQLWGPHECQFENHLPTMSERL
jgi:hypothetical protein